jgi:hypothetical protein
MNTPKIISFVLLLSLAIGGVAFAEDYDREVVVQVMRGNIGFMGEIGKAIEAEDYIMIGAGFADIAKGMIRILPFTSPPAGTDEQWNENITAFVLTAFKGVGAAGNRDMMVIQAAYNRLKELNRAGHGEHRAR